MPPACFKLALPPRDGAPQRILRQQFLYRANRPSAPIRGKLKSNSLQEKSSSVLIQHRAILIRQPSATDLGSFSQGVF